METGWGVFGAKPFPMGKRGVVNAEHQLAGGRCRKGRFSSSNTKNCGNPKQSVHIREDLSDPKHSAEKTVRDWKLLASPNTQKKLRAAEIPH